MKANDVTLFNNGIGHFRRTYAVPAGRQESISIPFRSNCIGDVAASLQVFGKVRLNTPPSFTPANSNATALRIDQDDALKSMLRQLSGSQVKLAIRGQTTEAYTLLGLDHETSVLNDEEINTSYVVAMRNGAVRRFLLTDVLDIEFEDEGVRKEIDKALKSNVQQITPDSTLFELSVSSLDDQEVEAVVQYTIPVAAWKMRYAIREDKDKFSLEGAAIIDNNTDEDWNNFKVSVVTGNPISFNTDIASVVVPQRRMVYLVDRLTHGNVDVEDGVHAPVCSMEAPQSDYVSRSLRSTRGGSDPDMDDDAESQYLPAESGEVHSEDVGDFCVFTAKEPITLMARKSAVIPMFSTPLDSAVVVLLYKESNNARRPYRVVKFKNETEYTLGRGKAVIYNEGIFSGESVLESTKPGENRMLPHCLEGGVRIIKESMGCEVRRSSLRLSAGVGVTEDVQTDRTIYTIENSKNEPFTVALEHISEIDIAGCGVHFDGVKVNEMEKLVDENGWRIYFQLKAKEVRTITVTETYLDESSVVLGNSFSWIRDNLVSWEGAHSSNKHIQACIKVQKEVDAVQEELQMAIGRQDELAQQIERVRKNLSAAKDHAASATIEKWIQDLDSSESEIRTINKKTVPDLNRKKKDLTINLADELKKITVTWNDHERALPVIPGAKKTKR